MADDEPPHRRRLDPEQVRKRDAEIMRLTDLDVPYRQIAVLLDCAEGTVQNVQRRELKKREKAMKKEQKQREQQQREQQQHELDDELDDLDDELDDITGSAIDKMTEQQLIDLERTAIMADLAADPTDALALYRLRHLPPVRL